MTNNPTTGVVASGADIAIYMWGSNDIHLNDTPAADYEARLRLWVTSVIAQSTKPVIQILGNHQPRLAWTDGSPKLALWHQYTQAMRSVAADYPDSVLVVEASSTFETMRSNGDTSPWAGDGVHVIDSGNAILADVYARALLV